MRRAARQEDIRVGNTIYHFLAPHKARTIVSILSSAKDLVRFTTVDTTVWIWKEEHEAQGKKKGPVETKHYMWEVEVSAEDLLLDKILNL